MIFEVEMLAFGKPGEVRKVNVPDDLLKGTDEDLETIFHYGQNDFQPKPHPSVSAGDVIRFGKRKVVIQMVGFKDLTETEYMDYCRLDNMERHGHYLI